MTSVERVLARIWRDVLRVESVGRQDSFFALGGDSITSLQISARAAVAGLRLTPRQVLEEETIAALANVAVVRAKRTETNDDPLGESILTPIQHWFFEQHIPRSHHWDQAVFVEINTDVETELVHQALRALVAHHDVLRSRFNVDGKRSRQIVSGGSAGIGFRVIDLRGVSARAQDTAMSVAITEAQQEIDLTAGPMLSAVLFRLGPDRFDRLMIAIHHLVVDGVSFRVLMEDLENAYRALRAGEEILLPAKTSSFRAWGSALLRHAATLLDNGQLDYWTSVPRADAVSLTRTPPPAGAAAENTVGRSDTITVELPEDKVAGLVRDVVRVRGTQSRDVLLAGLLLALRSVTGKSRMQLDLEGHGREPLGESLDLGRTVGWFTSLFPVVFELSERDDQHVAVDVVRKHLDTVPDKGVGYGILRYLGGERGAALAALPQSEISFNYLGWFNRPGGDDSVFGLPLQVPSPLRSAAAPRRYLLDVVVTGVAERLRIEITYACDFHTRDEIAELASRYVTALETLIAHYTAVLEGDAGSKDFPLMHVDARQLSSIIKQVGHSH